MLQQLYIKNFTLIDELDIELHPGFSVITGETGAGKSIILGAIGLLLGQRADSKSIKQGADRCVIEAHFDLSRYDLKPFFDENDIEYDDHDTIIRRELTAAGKSRAFINDTPVALTMLKELGDQLMDVHSQHQNLLLNKQDFQLNVVDILANDSKELEEYQQCFANYQQKTKELNQLREEIERNKQNADFLQFQYDELEAAQLAEGEQEELEQQSETMSHAEDIKTALYEADNALNGDESGVVSQVKSAYNALNAELDNINNRLDRLYELEKKYHVETVEELIQQRDDLKLKLSHIENSDEAVSEMEKEVAKLRSLCAHRAETISTMRRATADNMRSQLAQRLEQLGMPHARFDVSITKTELGKNGQDSISFLFSANTSTPLQPVSQVASGGEIARVMLSLKAMISGAVKLPTIIFDEIDTGVSGKIAEKMAQIMQEMGRTERQVISITHLPQIAALGSHHYRVSKEETKNGTVSHMTELNNEERITEIAQMLSGSDISDAAIQNAKELLKI